jgi:hypothetical protein
MSYTVNTLEDERVRSKCAEFEGYTANVSEAVIGVNHPPFDKDCRCFATYQIEGIRKKNKITNKRATINIHLQLDGNILGARQRLLLLGLPSTTHYFS